MRWCREVAVPDMVPERPSFGFYPDDFFGDSSIGEMSPKGQLAHLKMMGEAIRSGNPLATENRREQAEWEAKRQRLGLD